MMFTYLFFSGYGYSSPDADIQPRLALMVFISAELITPD